MQDISEYYDHWLKQKEEKPNHNMIELKKKLRHAAKLCASLLKKKYFAKSVYLIGSLTKSGYIWPHSDIDLAVEGISDEYYFKILVDLEKIVPKGVNIDLITMKDAKKSMIDHILIKGEKL